VNPTFILEAVVDVPMRNKAFDTEYNSLQEKCWDCMVFENFVDGLEPGKDQKLRNFNLPTVATTASIGERLETVMLLLHGEQVLDEANKLNPDTELLLFLGLNVTVPNKTLCERINSKLFIKNEKFTQASEEFKAYVQTLAKHKFAATKHTFISKVQEACKEQNHYLFSHVLLEAFKHAYSKRLSKKSFEPVPPDYCPPYLQRVVDEKPSIPESPIKNASRTPENVFEVAPSPSGRTFNAAEALINLSTNNATVPGTRDEIEISPAPSVEPVDAKGGSLDANPLITVAYMITGVDEEAQSVQEDQRGGCIDASHIPAGFQVTMEQEVGKENRTTVFPPDAQNIYKRNRFNFSEEARAIGASKWNVPEPWFPIWCERTALIVFFNEVTGQSQVIFFPPETYFFVIIFIAAFPLPQFVSFLV